MLSQIINQNDSFQLNPSNLTKIDILQKTFLRKLKFLKQRFIQYLSSKNCHQINKQSITIVKYCEDFVRKSLNVIVLVSSNIQLVFFKKQVIKIENLCYAMISPSNPKRKQKLNERNKKLIKIKFKKIQINLNFKQIKQKNKQINNNKKINKKNKKQIIKN
ncbi:hypothetical protein TTHERM_000529649 (macronuclear) [Tetrahymena thermophila SB210]|uniref:Uncharacterized protein n=1 Tax=Tetrahymena thermophila (strain SB210) TaxID=312017 RepID=W7XHC2_TETTS|nr:hypothetical protein TTHERM_000529649 [Tetrahymena thermophila SB210]EWS72454.1 hypothetical protein TTHERM_000529649 [Tetrahymena thermophila SB210]|eukprot:XP_012654999.1 hypothetical protein TTHERM_000529649 [Tetrahymena thermophila SB210]